MQIKTQKCDFCGLYADKIFARRDNDTQAIAFGCTKCWDMHDDFWFLMNYYKKLPETKGLSTGRRVWCRIVDETLNTTWTKGIINKIHIVETHSGQLYNYECLVEFMHEGEIHIGVEIYGEMDVWFRRENDDDLFDSITVSHEINSCVMHDKLYLNRYQKI